MASELHRTDCAISNDAECSCGGGIPLPDPVPQVPFDREAWQREFGRLNPGREDDVVYREYEGGAIIEYRGRPPVMPPMTADGRVLSATQVQGKDPKP